MESTLQPVAGEPSLGTWHEHYYRIHTAYDPLSTPTTIYIDLSGQVPVGATAVSVHGYFRSTTVGYTVAIMDTAGTKCYGWGFAPAANTYGQFVAPFVRLDADYKFRMIFSNEAIDRVDTWMNAYLI